MRCFNWLLITGWCVLCALCYHVGYRHGLVSDGIDVPPQGQHVVTVHVYHDRELPGEAEVRYGGTMGTPCLRVTLRELNGPAFYSGLMTVGKELKEVVGQHGQP